MKFGSWPEHDLGKPMITLYIFCAVIGGGLIVLSLFGGGDHEHGGEFTHDVSHDIGHDVGHDLTHDGDLDHGNDHEGGEAGGFHLLFLSLRFWTYLVAVFGVCGLALSFVTDSKEPATALLSAGTGFLSGFIAAGLVNIIRRNEADSTARERDFLGVRGKVTVPIREQQMGRIRTTVKGELIDVLAYSEEAQALPEGSEVVIIGMENGKASVVPLESLLEEKA